MDKICYHDYNIFLFELYNLYKVCYVYNKRYSYLITRKLELRCEIKC